MARKIQFELEDGTIFLGYFQKITKQDLYGTKKVLKATEEGEELQTITITQDGTTLLPSGSISSQYSDSKGHYIPRSELIATEADGEPIKITESMFHHENRLKIISFEELFRYDIKRSYILKSSGNIEDFIHKCLQLFNEDKLYKFTYAYRDTTNPHDAILLPKNNNIFILVGDYAPLEWQSSQIDINHFQKLAEGQDSIDFEESW